MISISSDPFAIGIRTCFPCQININVITKQPTFHQNTPEANHTISINLSVHMSMTELTERTRYDKQQHLKVNREINYIAC
jgi:phage anti-repressor protein